MQSHETLRHRQAQAGSLVTTVHPVIELPERLEGGRYVLREHADPVVGYGYPDLAGALFAGRHRDLAPRRRELHGIRQQVEHDLFQPQFVDPNEGQAARGLVGELDAGLLGMRQDEPDATSYELPDVRDLLVQLEAVGLDLRQIEDVVYEIEQMLAGAEDVLSVSLYRTLTGPIIASRMISEKPMLARNRLLLRLAVSASSLADWSRISRFFIEVMSAPMMTELPSSAVLRVRRSQRPSARHNSPVGPRSVAPTTAGNWAPATKLSASSGKNAATRELQSRMWSSLSTRITASAEPSIALTGGSAPSGAQR